MQVNINIKKPDILEKFMNFINDNADTLILDTESRDEIEYLLKVDQFDEDMCDLFFLENINDNYMMLRLRALSKLSLNIFELHPDKFNWMNISLLDLPETFIEANIDRLNMKIISTKTLSSDFITKHHKELTLHSLLLTNKLPREVKNVYKNEIALYREEMKVKSNTLNEELLKRNEKLIEDAALQNRAYARKVI
jgi:hypothetical protein